MKKGRHEAIIELIRKENIENQSELAAKLNEQGYNVTQATVSRDIAKLNLIKVKQDGKFKYVVLENTENFGEKYVNIIRETLVYMDIAKNLLVVKTQPGMAMATAAAFDGLKLQEIVGSIAGDDSVFFATKSDEDAFILLNKIELIIKKVNNA